MNRDALVEDASAEAAGAAPDRRAAALAYEAVDVAAGRSPRVVAKGQGLIADEIIERARAAGVPIHASRELVTLLMQLDLDSHIPPALYVAVAEVLAWVYRIEERMGPKQGPRPAAITKRAADGAGIGGGLAALPGLAARLPDASGHGMANEDDGTDDPVS
jgi:flagellar biosynthesis protein